MTAEDYLRRAIVLAGLGRGTAEPNPLVGCVLVKDRRTIGEGYHARYGGMHAEPTALATCTDDPAGATAFVTLEPCCHANKQTPPCAPRLIAAGVGRVVVGCLDPNPAVNGRGVALLRSAGVRVDGPLLEPACRQLIAPFLARVVHGRPYVTMKWAESADGKVAGPGGRRVQISNAASSLAVQRLRSRCDAILVGVGTAIADDPLLLPRVPLARPTYWRVVSDTHLRLPPDGRLARSVDRGPVVVFTTVVGDGSRRRALADRGVEVVTVEATLGSPSFTAALSHLSAAGVTHLLVEPGPTLAAALLPAADRLWVIRSPMRIDDPTAPAAAAVPTSYVSSGMTLDCEGDQLTEYLNTRSDVFAAAQPSADLVAEAPGVLPGV